MHHDSPSDLRRLIRDRRATVEVTERLSRNAQLTQRVLSLITNIFPNRAHSTLKIAAFNGKPEEPSIDWRDLALAGYEVYLPRSIPETSSLEWVRVTADSELQPGAYSIDEPLGGASSDIMDMYIIPALSIDAHGNRLGQGGGYYDRELARFSRDDTFLPSRVEDEKSSPVSNITSVGVIDSAEFVDALPTYPWDMKVSYAMTPENTFSL